MIKLKKYCQFEAGPSPSRIAITDNPDSPLYKVYSQQNIEDDLVGSTDRLIEDEKQVRTDDEVPTLQAGDLVLSTVSGTAAIVNEARAGFIFTNNYTRLIPNELIDRKYLAYLINENSKIKKQLLVSSQGSSVIRFNLSQFQNLNLPGLPDLAKQQLIGQTYFDQLRLKYLQNQRANLETAIVLRKLKEFSDDKH